MNIFENITSAHLTQPGSAPCVDYERSNIDPQPFTLPASHVARVRRADSPAAVLSHSVAGDPSVRRPDATRWYPELGVLPGNGIQMGTDPQAVSFPVPYPREISPEMLETMASIR